MMKKRKLVVILLLLGAFFILAGSLYFLNQRFHFLADEISYAPYVLFKKPTFDYVMPDYVPKNDEIIQSGETLALTAAKGEIEPLTFSVRANQDLGEVTIDYSDLVDDKGNKIPKENIELFNIKVWEQCNKSSGCTNNPENKVLMPELLVKDNEQDLLAEATTNILPTLNSDFKSTVSADESHTYYLKFNLPESVVAGSYSGSIQFSPGEESINGKSFKIDLQVLDYSLPESSKEHLVYFWRNPSNADISLLNIGKDSYNQYLDIFKKSGMSNIIARNNEVLWIADRLKEKNFYGTVFVGGLDYVNNPENAQSVMEYYRQKGFDPYIYIVDEPYLNLPLMQSAVEKSRVVHDMGERATTGINYPCAAALANPNSTIYQNLNDIQIPQPLDLVNYNFFANGNQYASGDTCVTDPTNYGFFKDYFNRKASGDQVDKIGKKEFFYHQIWKEYILQNRVLAGFALYNGDFDGMSMYGVTEHYSGHGPNIYNDFDSSITDNAVTSQKKEHNTLYPSTDGPVLTLQWEAMREGIDDSRYLTYADTLAKEIETKFNKEQADVYRNRVKDAIYKYRFGGIDGKDAWDTSLSTQIADDTRAEIITLISAMQDKINNTDSPKFIDINISENQVITANPYLITAKATDDIKVEKVEFYIDGNLIGTSTLPDVSGIYEASWDTAKYHSVVRVVAYDENGNTSEVIRNTTVQLPQNYTNPIITILPKTGQESWMERFKYRIKTFFDLQQNILDQIR